MLIYADKLRRVAIKRLGKKKAGIVTIQKSVASIIERRLEAPAASVAATSWQSSVLLAARAIQ
jgi:hypothetical protein